MARREGVGVLLGSAAVRRSLGRPAYWAPTEVEGSVADDMRSTLQAAFGNAHAIEQELTGGGMSRVFLAAEAALRPQVVIKVLPSGMARAQ